VQQAYPEAEVEGWAFDEHRIGLKPILRRVWVRKGKPAVAIVHQRYQWSYVYGFVQPERGRTSWLLMPTVNVEAFNIALSHFAQEVGAGKEKRVVLVLDRAGWHTSPEVLLPEGIHLTFLPPYSPELQPAEHLWPLSNEPLANRPFQSLDELEAVQAERCRRLQYMEPMVRSHTLFHWWPGSP